MKTRRVLIIDNDPGELEKHSRILSEARFSVLAAGNCAEADGILKRFRGRATILSGLSVDGECMVAFMKKTLAEYPFIPFLFLVSSPSLDRARTMRPVRSITSGSPSPGRSLRIVSRSMDRMKALLDAEKMEGFHKKLAKTGRRRRTEGPVFLQGFMISMAAQDSGPSSTFWKDNSSSSDNAGCPVSGDGVLLLRANRTVGRLLSMTNTLLDYEAAETGRIRLEVNPFPLEETLRECLEFFIPYAEQKRVRLRLDPVPPGIMVKGDREKVREILDNLLYNALKFTPAEGIIRLSGRKDMGTVEISVSDSGQGMTEEKLRNLFNQEKIAATLDAHARIGLGMMICKKLVEVQGGKIRVNSVPGKGTTVFFTLPSV
jgi:signal transduction histidine kinase